MKRMSFISYFKILILALSFVPYCTYAQQDTTSTAKGKWQNLKNKAKEKTQNIKSSINSSEKNNNTGIEGKQYIAAKSLNEGEISEYEMDGPLWVKSNNSVNIKLNYDDEGNVKEIILDKDVFERGKFYEGKYNHYLDTYFYSETLKVRGLFVGGSFVTFHYFGTYNVIEKLRTYGKCSMGPGKLKKNLTKYKEVIDAEMNELPDNKFEFVSPYQDNDWRVVHHKDKYGLINREHQFEVDLVYDYISYLDKGYFWVKKDGTYRLLNPKGEFASEELFDATSEFNEAGIASIRQGRNVGFLESKNLGKTVVFKDVDYNLIYAVNDNYICTQSNKMGLVDKKGNVILPIDYSQINSPSLDDIYPVQGTDGNWGLFKVNHGWITERVYRSAEVYTQSSPSTFGVKTKSEYYENPFDECFWGTVDSKGNVVWCEDKGNYRINKVATNTTPANPNPKKELLEWRNKYATPFKAVVERPFPVQDKATKKWGLLDYKGNVIVEPKYIEVNLLSHGNFYLWVSVLSAYEYNTKENKIEPELIKFEPVMPTNYSSSGSSGASSSSSSSSSSGVSVEIRHKRSGAPDLYFFYTTPDGSQEDDSVDEGGWENIKVKPGSKIYGTVGNHGQGDKFLLLTAPSSGSVKHVFN